MSLKIVIYKLLFFSGFIFGFASIGAQTNCNINTRIFDDNNTDEIDILNEINNSDSNSIKIIAIRGFHVKGKNKDYILTLCQHIPIFDTTCLKLYSYENLTSKGNPPTISVFNSKRSIRTTISYNSHATLLISKNKELLEFIKNKLGLKFFQQNQNKNKERYSEVLTQPDNRITSDSAHIDQIKILCVYIPVLINEYNQNLVKLELQNELANLNEKLILNAEYYRPSLEIGYLQSLSSSYSSFNGVHIENYSRKVLNAIQFNTFIPFARLSENFKLGLNLGIANSNLEFQVDYRIENLNTQLKSDEVSDIYYNLINSDFSSEKLKINQVKINVELQSELKLNTWLYNVISVGVFSDYNYASSYINEGISKVQRVYPQYSNQPIFDNVFEKLYQNTSSLITPFSINQSLLGLSTNVGAKIQINSNCYSSISYRGELGLSLLTSNSLIQGYFKSPLEYNSSINKYSHFLLIKFGVKI